MYIYKYYGELNWYIFIFINDWSIYWFSSIDKSIRFGRSVGRAILWPHGVISFVHSFFVFIYYLLCVCFFHSLSRRSLIACFLSSFVSNLIQIQAHFWLQVYFIYLLEQVNFRFYTLLLFSCFDLDFIVVVVVIVGDDISLLFLFTILLFSYSLFVLFWLVLLVLVY